MTTIGSLFTGMGGLDLAAEHVFGGRTAWTSDVDPGARKVIAHRYPDAPNLGDITAIDWEAVEPVDIITGGSPCQDLSAAGKRSGMRAGTRSGLWASMLEGIHALRPRHVIWENVGGAYSACAHSDLEPCPGCVGDGPHRPVLRALGRVLGDLASVGYDASWCGLRAADVGAPHGRFRVFVLATDTESDAGRVGHGDDVCAGRAAVGREPTSGRGGAATDTRGEHGQQRRQSAPGQAASRRPLREPTGRGRAPVTLLPTPMARDFKGSGPADAHRHDPNLSAIGHLLPTPRATDGTKGGPNQRGSSGDLMLPSAVHLLPTPTAADSKASGGDPATSNVPLTDATVRGRRQWGQYAPAIARWEAVTGQPAPAPTETSARGSQRLSPAFTQWMMGLPAGWITEVPGVTRNEALKLCGNGVVPHQAVAALEHMLAFDQAAAA